MQILHDFDAAACPPSTMTDAGVCFDLRPRQQILNVLVRDPRPTLEVDLLVDEKGEGFLLRQGLVVSGDGIEFRAVPLTKVGQETLRATVQTHDGEVRLASRYPYGRDHLDKLICETAGIGGVTWRFLRQGHRGFPMAQLGEDDGSKTIHYFFAGEDAWETAGCWVADEMVRELASNAPLATALTADSLVRIVPLVSPYSATTSTPSYRTLAGAGIYGAATWGDAEPPPEYAALRQLVATTIGESRLGCMLTIHSWQAQSEKTGLETIQRAGDSVLCEARQAWAREAMDQLIDGVPHGATAFPERIWHPGLARDHLLAAHDAITFRVEITTAGAGLEMFRETGRRFAGNLAKVADWRPVCATGA